MLSARKGMPTVTVVVGLVSTLLIGSAVLGSLQAIKTTSLDPNVDRTQGELDQVGDTKVTIAGTDSEIARQQMQGAIVWNMLASSDCRILTTFNSISQAKQGQDLGDDVDFDPDEMPAEPVDGRVFKTSSGEFLDELSPNEGNGYTGNFGDFMPLVNSGFDTPCVGTQSTIKQVEDAASEASNDAVGGLFSIATKAVGAGLVVAGAGACVLTAGGACVAVAGGAGLYMSSGVASDLAAEVIVPGAQGDIGAEPGFDMEGVFGRIEFETENTFLMGTDDPEDPFLGLALKVEEPANTPGFWRGRRFSYLVPAGLSPDTFNKNEYHRIYNPGGYAAEGTRVHVRGRQYKTIDALGIEEGQSKLTGKHFWNEPDPEIPGTNQERNKMMFYAFRPRMENVPILAAERITQDILTDGCSTDDCERDVIRLANFLEHTSYLFCEEASGQIQSNAGHIYSSDEATSQVGPVEDQVYPKVEITDKATECVPDMDLNVPDNVNLDCDPEALVSGASVEVFSRQTADRGTHTVDVVCGTNGGEQAANLGGYGYVDYYITEQTISQEGCFPDWYDITSDSSIQGGEPETDAHEGVEQAVDTEAYTVDREDYPIFLYENSRKFWTHNFDTRYYDSDGQDEIGGTGENNRITYERISAEYNASTVENLTYRVSMQGLNSGRVDSGMVRALNVNRTIIIEEKPETSETIVREVAENSGSSITYMRQAVITDQNFSGQVRNLVIDRTNEGGISINGVNLAGFEGFPDQIAVTDIEISPVRDPEDLNRRYDWDAESVRSVSDLGGTQADLELRNVQSYSEPRICKGEAGIWQSRPDEVIEGE